AMLASSGSSHAQVSGGFVAKLGVHTVHVERVVRERNKVSGVVVMRTPLVRVVRWSLTYDARGRRERYEVSATDAAGAPVLNDYSGTMSYVGDTIIREAYQQGVAQTRRIPAPFSANPSPGLPYIGVSYLMYEDAFD